MVGLAAGTASAEGVNAMDWNPALLAGMNDWEISATEYSLTTGTFNPTLQATTLGRRFFPDDAAAIRLTPGIGLGFIVPTSFTVKDAQQSVINTYDKKITYSEPYAAGYAHKIRENLSVGIGFRAVTEEIDNTQYSIDTNGVITSNEVDYSGMKWTLDGGIVWSPNEEWKFGATVQNFAHISGTKLPDQLSQYALGTPGLFRLGVGYSPASQFSAAFDFDNEKKARLGTEWNIANHVSVREGLYADNYSRTFVDAVGVGAGVSFERLRFDCGYLKFTDETNRNGTADISRLGDVNVNNIEFNPFSSDRVSLTASVELGNIRELYSQIEYAEITTDIFPCARTLYAFKPVGKARVRNISTKPLTVRTSFMVDGLMDKATESEATTILPDEVKEIPFFAVFNEKLQLLTSLSVYDGDVSVVTAGSEEYGDRFQTRVLIHGRNDWNGDVMQLKFFVVSDDSEILKFTRHVLNNHKSTLDTLPTERRAFDNARVIFDEFATQVTYVSDPKKSADYVQYPSETLILHGGNCSDLTVAYSSMLSSIGISVAFIDVIPPDHPADSHIYMMFDTGIPAAHSSLVSENPKRYVIRKNESGIETVWVPVEPTALKKGFDSSWEVAAQEYLQDVSINLGTVKGWVKIVDLQVME